MTNLIATVIITLVTNWTVVEEINDKTPPQLSVMTYDVIKEVGTIHTNEYLKFKHNGKIYVSFLGTLGKQEWPTQTRVRTVPSRYRKDNYYFDNGPLIITNGAKFSFPNDIPVVDTNKVLIIDTEN